MFIHSLSFLIVPLLAHLASGQQQTCTRTYTVQEDDICDSISAANNVSTYQLAVVNDKVIDPDCDNLYPGQNLCLGWQGEDCQDTYVVQAEDTCDYITYAHNLNLTIFYANNPQINEDCTNMYIGEVMCVCQTVLVPPPPASGTMPGSAIPPSATPVIPWCD